MGKITKILGLLSIICIVASCVSTKRLVVQNYTDKVIDLDIDFLSKDGGPSTINMQLKPGHINGWHYDLGKFEKDPLDERIQSITIRTMDGCESVLDRKGVEQVAEKRSNWDIILKAAVVKCGTTDLEPKPFEIQPN